MNFDPTKVKCVNDGLFLEMFVNDQTIIKGPGGQDIKLERSKQVFSESYALVHSAGEQIKGISPGDYVIVKPGVSAKGGFEIKGKKYAFFSNYEICAVIP